MFIPDDFDHNMEDLPPLPPEVLEKIDWGKVTHLRNLLDRLLLAYWDQQNNDEDDPVILEDDNYEDVETPKLCVADSMFFSPETLDKEAVWLDWFPLPLEKDTYIIGGFVGTEGDMTGVDRITTAHICSERLELCDCADLIKLPEMCVRFLNLKNCPKVLEFNENDYVLEKADIRGSGIVRIPEGFKSAQIWAADCPNLREVHPDIPLKNFKDLSHQQVQTYKMNYLFNEKISNHEFNKHFNKQKAIWKRLHEGRTRVG